MWEISFEMQCGAAWENGTLLDFLKINFFTYEANLVFI